MPGRAGSYKGLGAAFQGVENVSLASTRVTLTDSQQGRLLILDGSTDSTVEIALPAPEEGMNFFLLFSTGSVSNVTKVLSTSYQIRVDGSTAKGVAFGSTAETGQGIWLFGRSEVEWIAMGLNPATTLATATS